MSKIILDKFGELVTQSVYDDAISYFKQLVEGSTKWGTGKEYTEVLQKLNAEDHQILTNYLKDTIGTAIFGMLGIFEENPEFKIIYEKDGERVDLAKASEMLKAEPTIEGGWIDRFSQYSEKSDPSRDSDE